MSFSNLNEKTMKQFLLCIFLIAAFSNTEAQKDSTKSRFAFVSIYFDDVYKIKIDSGQVAVTKKTSFVTDSSGNDLKFVSSGAALNYLGAKGWKLHTVLHDIDEGYSGQWMRINTRFIYLFKKEY
jgi:hypothetical protein